MYNFSSEYFIWMLMGALILTYWRHSLINHAWVELLLVNVIVIAQFYLGLPIVTVMVSLSLIVWIIAQQLNLMVLPIFCFFVILLSIFFAGWLPVALVVSAVLFFLTMSWIWVNHHINYFSMLQLLCVLAMGGILVMGLNEWTLGIFVLSFIILHTINNEVKRQKSQQSDAHWVEMIEQSRILERQRIYNNIHDEVGASLLQLIYQLDGKEAQAQAKSVMQKIRNSVADTAKYAIKFNDLYDDICSEAQVRLLSASIAFHHHKSIKDDSYLEVELPVYLVRMIRETISNIIRHSNASEVSLKAIWHNDQKSIVITDNGRGFSVSHQLGKGLNSMKKRAQKINAQVSWHSIKPSGTTIHIEMMRSD